MDEIVKGDKLDSGQNAVEYLETVQLAIVKKLYELSESGKMDDGVKLGAAKALLNKIVPDKTKVELVGEESPMDKLRKALSDDGK
jgi:hypothetical protein